MTGHYPCVPVRQILAVAAAALLAGIGAVVLGEYPLEGTTAIIGFPLYAVAVTELALAVGKRLALPTLAAIAAVVAGGLAWALWISFGHFRNDVAPPPLSWAMAAVAVLVTVAWGRSGQRRHPGGTEAAAPGAVDEEALP